ncbi:MAG: glycosyl transferase [Candidatus Marinimicrobia bacterium]|nr:glycosyl transferase [Candidatus Neomarinimicrobiota bacterium]
MENRILVSIITPTYNSVDFVSRTIDSVCNQTYENWELLIVDDCSEDETVKFINEKYSSDKRIRVIRLEKNSGVGPARNLGIELCRGEFVAFLDSDDIWLENKLEYQLGFMIKNNIPICCTSYFTNNRRKKLIRKVPESISYYRILLDNCIGTSTVIYDKRSLDNLIFPDIRRRQDFILWLEYLREGDVIHGINIPLSEYTIRPQSLSFKKFRLIYWNWKVYKDFVKLSIFTCSLLVLKDILIGVVRKINHSI